MKGSFKPDMLLRHYRDKILKALKTSINWKGCILDVGCGDAMLWINDYFRYKAQYVVGLDIVWHNEWKKVKNAENVDYVVGDAGYLPFKQQAFSIVFEKDTLHHVGAPQRTLEEICRVSREQIILVEANRYNPISFLHMVKLRGHQHFSQKKFISMVLQKAKNSKFSFIEAHYFPFRNPLLMRLYAILEEILERFLVSFLRSYNVAIANTPLDNEVRADK